MARPFKQGLEYFPFDCSFFDDPRIKDLLIECGYLGLLVYIRILTLVYKNGYYLEASVDNLAKMIFRDFQGSTLRRVDRISEVIRSIAKCGLIDTLLMTSDVITSSSIQKQWLTSTSRRKNIDKSKYWLLSEMDEASIKKFSDTYVLSSYNNLDNDDNNLFNVNNNQINDNNSTQKEKKKETDKTIKKDKTGFSGPELHFLTKVIVGDGYIKKSSDLIFKYNDMFSDLVYDYGFETCLKATNYLMMYVRKNKPVIENRFEFLKASLINNCELLKNRSMKGDVNFGGEIERFIQSLVKKD